MWPVMEKLSMLESRLIADGVLKIDFTAELLVDKALELKYIGGVYGGNVKPTPFLCLLLKMLQIQPAKDIIVEFIAQQEYK